jgi:precorrin-6Y C5,15-methyltransferase (decarboxylating)
VVPLQSLFDEIRQKEGEWIVFASGDPLFFGIGNTLKREIPEAEIQIIPTFNSLQLLGHRLGIPYGEFQTVTLTGRPWDAFDQALIQGVAKMGILTDRKHTPAAIARRMLDYRYDNYQMYYGEHMGGENEKVLHLTLEEALNLDFSHPNCLYLEKTDDRIPAKGIKETYFEPLEGRPNMITKMPARLTTLALMQLHNRKVFWDVGACTGSISIEARLHHPHLKMVAYEKRVESEGIIDRNTKRFQTPGIDVHIGDYMSIDKKDFVRPDAIFLGGYGGQMDVVLDDVDDYLQEDGVLAFNSVSEKSRQQFLNWCSSKGYALEIETVMKVNEFNTLSILVARK